MDSCEQDWDGPHPPGNDNLVRRTEADMSKSETVTHTRAHTYLHTHTQNTQVIHRC